MWLLVDAGRLLRARIGAADDARPDRHGGADARAGGARLRRPRRTARLRAAAAAARRAGPRRRSSADAGGRAGARACRRRRGRPRRRGGDGDGRAEAARARRLAHRRGGYRGRSRRHRAGAADVAGARRALRGHAPAGDRRARGRVARLADRHVPRDGGAGNARAARIAAARPAPATARSCWRCRPRSSRAVSSTATSRSRNGDCSRRSVRRGSGRAPTARASRRR